MPCETNGAVDKRRALWTAGEVVAAVAVATGVVAVLDTIAPITGLSGVPLLPVLVVAIRRGVAAGLVAAVLSVLALNFFFIEPRYQLTIAQGENVAALVVFLIAAIVVGRLAEAARDRAREAEARAAEAASREAEAELVAAVAGRLLGGGSLDEQLAWIGERVAGALGAASARVELATAPTAHEGERSLRLPTRVRPAWLYTRGGADPERVAAPLAGVMDVALERERLAAARADAETARRAEAAKTAVLRAISHDLRTPLTAITAAAEALADPQTSAEDRADLHAVLAGESRRLARLVDDLLDLSRIEAGAVNPQRDWVDLHDVVARAAAGRPAVQVELPADLPLVRADAAQLERVFGNLVENAVKFSPEGAPVRVTGGTSGGRVTVRVIDPRPRVPQGQRSPVFEPFFRGRATGPGAGLGLAISRGFVEANGGRLVLQSDGRGETAFAVTLRAEAPPP